MKKDTTQQPTGSYRNGYIDGYKRALEKVEKLIDDMLKELKFIERGQFNEVYFKQELKSKIKELK